MQHALKGSEETANCFFIKEISMHFLVILLRSLSKLTIMIIMNALLFC